MLSGRNNTGVNTLTVNYLYFTFVFRTVGLDDL